MKIYYTLLFFVCPLLGSQESAQKQLTFQDHVNQLEIYLNENDSQRKNGLLINTVTDLNAVANHDFLNEQKQKNPEIYAKFQQLPLQEIINSMEKKSIANDDHPNPCCDMSKKIYQRALMQCHLSFHNKNIIFTELQQQQNIYDAIKNFQACRCRSTNHEACKAQHLSNSKNGNAHSACEFALAGLVQLYINTEAQKGNTQTKNSSFSLTAELLQIQFPTATTPLQFRYIDLKTSTPVTQQITITPEASLNTTPSQQSTITPISQRNSAQVHNNQNSSVSSTEMEQEKTSDSLKNVVTPTSPQAHSALNIPVEQKCEEPTNPHLTQQANTSLDNEEQTSPFNNNETTIDISEKKEKKEPSGENLTTPQKRSIVKPLLTLCLLFVIIKYCYSYAHAATFFTKQFTHLYS
jgi:hypothetical protein